MTSSGPAAPPAPASAASAPPAPASAASAPPAPASGRPALMLPTLVRLGGLPACAVPRPQNALITALEEVRRLDRETERAAGRLLDPLYELIPLLDRDERRAVLHAKRKVFQSRASGLSARVRAGLPSDIGAMLIDWDRLMAQRRNARTRLDKAVAADLENSRALLAHSLDDPDYLRSVAIAAPALVSTLARRGRRLDDPRVLRTLYSLASRTALKTSPFSGLTTVSEAGRPARGRRRCTVALHLAHGILMAVARDLDPAGHLRLEAATVRDDVVPAGTDKGEAAGLATDPVGAADAARPATGPALTVVAEHDYANGMIFRREEIQPARWLAAAHDRLTGGLTDAPPVSVREAVRLVGGRDPRLRLRRLLASGAVRPHPPWARGEDPFPALAATLSESQRGAWAEDLGRLVELGRAVTVEDGTDRAERLADAGRLAQRVFPDHELGARPAGLLYEDCESRGERTDPMEQVTFRRDVETLAGLVDPWVTRSRIYDLMVERYVARYGRGGVCEDPLAFFMSLAHAPDGDAQMLRAAGQDLASGPDPERAAMPGGVSASPRHVGAYLQPVVVGRRASADDDRTDEPAGAGSGGRLTVVNAFTNGNGALQARFHRLLGRQYRQRLARGIRAAWGIDRVLEIQVSTDCNTAQAVSCGVLPPLGLPGEPESAQAVPLSSLRLAHDPRTDTLFLADARGPVGLAYLGLISQHRLGGYLAWLVLLSDPWARLAPMADHWTSRRRRMDPLPDEPVHSPRTVHGRLVTRRQSWIFPAGHVAGLLDRDSAATLVRVASLRERWGIPAEVYVHQHRGPDAVSRAATFDEHKPRYVDLRSPASLLALHGWIDPAAEHLSLIEALPARDQQAGVTPSGRTTALEYLVGLQWPKNDGDVR